MDGPIPEPEALDAGVSSHLGQEIRFPLLCVCG